jgi:hypothetical protein
MNNADEEYEDDVQPAATLRLCGSAGEFSVGTAQPEDRSVRVLYIQTAVSFSLTGGQDEQLLDQLKPVREIFHDEDLDFSQLLQREIDDARVSFELIPYLLESPSQGLVKFFPPIIVVVLPVVPGTNTIADYYPSITGSQKADKRGNIDQQTMSGALGSESFDFHLKLDANGRIAHSRPSVLGINPHNTRLVIVDGQHRAMALLALYRNLRSKWPKDDLGQAIEKYYSHWDKSTLGDFKLDGVSLPVVVCVFPELHAQSELRVHEACRRVFLSLNKNARPVSRARNILLDDNHLVAHFTRCLLSSIKNVDKKQKNIRLWSVDFEENGASLASEAHQSRHGARMALTSVTHFYQTIFIALMSPDSLTGLKPSFGLRRGRPVRDFSAALAAHRLDLLDELGSEAAANVRVDAFDKKIVPQLVERFWTRYGSYMLRIMEGFAPFDAHHRAYLDLQTNKKLTPRLRTILFQSEGSDQVFRAFQSEFESFAQQYSGDYLKKALEELKADVGTLDELRNDFVETRTKNMLSAGDAALSSRTSYPHSVWRRLNELYEYTFKTQAFQFALFLTFFTVAERLIKSAPGHSNTVDLDQLVSGYLSALNEFFAPTSVSSLKNLIEVFLGDVRGAFSSLGDPKKEWSIHDSKTCLLKILVSEKKNPLDWGKFRYMLLEVWLHRTGGACPAALASLIESECLSYREALAHEYARRRLDLFMAEGPEAGTLLENRDKLLRECGEALATGVSRLWPHNLADRGDAVSALREQFAVFVTVKGGSDIPPAPEPDDED